MKQLLNQAQRAQPAADGSAQHKPPEHNDAENIETDPVSGGRQGILERSQRTGSHRGRAGITVKAGHTDKLTLAGIDLPLDEAFYIGVIQKCRIHLYETPFRGTVALPP